VLDAMIHSRGMPGRRLLWLHEAGLDALLRAWLGDHAERLPAGEPAGDAPDWIVQALEAKPGLPAGLRFLADHAELDGLIVNSAACRDLVLAALGPRAAAWPVEVAFLPIEPRVAAARSPAGDGTLRIGSFGHAGDPKRLECVVRAVDLLARSRPVRLLIAGWQAGRYCRRTGIDRHRHVEVLDAPDDGRLDEAMRRVDVAVQLRTPSFGESSGVVNQLLAIGTPLVTSRIGSFAELPADLVRFVPPAAHPADLVTAIVQATAIAQATAARPAEAARAAFLAARSHEAFAARLATILAAEPAAATGPGTTAACSPAAA
jgi:glycosyltransferase involved in cell wall biosynthesis